MSLDGPIFWGMTDSETTPRMLFQLAPSDAFAQMTASILDRLGYSLLRVDAADARDASAPPLPKGDLILVDERRFAELEADLGDAAKGLPIVLLTGREGAIGADPRVVGAVRKPAGLHDLYRLLQQIFEQTPRTTPRIATHLRAQCTAQADPWDGRVLSLSENGCLLRSPEPIMLGDQLRIEIHLPQGDAVEVEAEANYQLLPDTGLVFHAVGPAEREVLSRYVAQAILSN